jgi:NAD(P)-dependent dehydrogenase (short-subunit alcohol dehydrogenase family)
MLTHAVLAHLAHRCVHVLVNNAAVAPPLRSTTATTRRVVETQWAVNVLGYDLMTTHLIH